MFAHVVYNFDFMSNSYVVMLFFSLNLNLTVFSQTSYLIPFQDMNHIKDSIVEIEVERKQEGIWKDNAHWKNWYKYDKSGFLIEALVLDQKFIPKYKNGRVNRILVYNKKKRQTKLIYRYNEKGLVFKIEIYDFLKGFPSFSGSENLVYDTLNNIISSSYTIESNFSSHTGHNHSAKYFYDVYGRLTLEDWGYKQKKHFFDDDGKIEFSIILDNEFGSNEYRWQYKTLVTKYN